MPTKNQFVPSQIQVAPSFCASAKLVPPAKILPPLSGVMVAVPAPLFVKILNSPDVEPGPRVTARAVPLLHIMCVAVALAVPSALISEL